MNSSLNLPSHQVRKDSERFHAKIQTVFSYVISLDPDKPSTGYSRNPPSLSRWPPCCRAASGTRFPGGRGAGRSLRGPLAKRSPSHAHWPHGRSPLETRREARADEPALLFADTIPHCGYNHESGKLTPRLAFPPRGFIPSSDVSQTWASEEGHCQVWINQLWSACHCRTWPLGPPRGGDVGSPLTSLIVPDRYFSKVKGELMGKMEVLWVKHHTCACVCVFTSLRRLIPSQEYAHENVKLELSF